MSGAEWGPWIEHDGKGCPCRGQFVHMVYAEPGITVGTGEWGDEEFGIAESDGSWLWRFDYVPIIRYRIRKPRGLTVLEGILREVETTHRKPERVTP